MNIALIAGTVWLVIISAVGFVLPIVDKRRAQKDKWRIRERTLFIVSILGGSVAMYISMRIFHHKTKHAGVEPKPVFTGIFPPILCRPRSTYIQYAFVRSPRLDENLLRKNCCAPHGE